MKKRNFFAALIFSLSCLTAAPQATAQTNNLEQKIKRLVLAVGEAERTINAEKFAALTTDDFSELKSPILGASTKSQILDDWRGLYIWLPTGFRKVVSMIKFDAEMTNISIKKVGGSIEFKCLLVEHSLLNITEDDNQTSDFKEVKRFETTGTAVWQNGKWLLSSLQKKPFVNPDKAQSDREIEEEIEFQVAVERLMANERLKPPPLIHTELTAPIDPMQARMIFRREYYNYAHRFNHKGWFIDIRGNVYKYEYKLASNNQSGKKFAFKTLPTLIARIPSDSLLEKLDLSKEAAKGSFSRKPYARDAGTLTYSEFRINPLTYRIEETKLKESGDFNGTNDTPEAAELVEWLETVFRQP